MILIYLYKNYTYNKIILCKINCMYSGCVVEYTVIVWAQ